MKAAVVLAADDASVSQQAAGINAVLEGAAHALTRVELWVVHLGHPPEALPAMDFPLARICLAAVKQTHVSESCLGLLQHLLDRNPMDLVVFPGSGWGNEMATRLAFRANGCACVQVEACDTASGQLEVRKPVYGNNLSAWFAIEQHPCCLAVAKQPCAPARMNPLHAAPLGSVKIERIEWKHAPPVSAQMVQTIPDPPTAGLAHAERALVVGQGAGNMETVDLLHSVAEILGAELGASRPVVMNAWVPMNRLIGTSGSIIAPGLCIAAGVSGAGVFSVGIRYSECIVAINTDPRAPIFQIADIGIVGDLKEVLTELADIIRTNAADKTSDDAVQGENGEP